MFNIIDKQNLSVKFPDIWEIFFIELKIALY